MAKVLSKYTRSKDLTQNIEFASQQEFMTAIANGLKINAAGDLYRPYSFREWFDKQTALIPGEEYKQYSIYLNRWYESRKSVNPITVDTSQVYFNFIQQLQIFFRDMEDERFTDLDINNPAELVDAVPYYARKLRDIARYLIFKREAVKRAKLKYNVSGAYQAIERLFYEYLLKAFTKNKIKNEYTVIPELSVLEALPDLSAVTGNFQIYLDELYDDSSYFDRDSQLSATSYFSYSSAVSAYLEDFGILTLNDFEWLYDTGVSQLCSNNPWLWAVDEVIAQYENGNIPLSALDGSTSNLLNDYNRILLSKKYLGEDQYIISGGYYIPWVKTFSLPMISGNNWFYWPSGSTGYFITKDLYVEPIILSATSLIESGATPASTYREADVIFTQRGSQLSGAWLQSPYVTSTVVTMSAKLVVGFNSFVYPFPGFGLSGEDVDWTGRGLSNLDYTFNYLDDDTKQAVYKAYWAAKQDANKQYLPLSIHQTTLIDDGAYADVNYISADSLIADNALNPFNTVYQNPKTIAWLYRISATNIPVLSGTNYIYWPYERYAGTPTLNNILSGKQICEAVYLSAIPIEYFCGACAADTLTDADVIYKLDSPNGKEMEAAWLSGTNLSSIYIGVDGAAQIGLATKVDAGAEQSFLWTSTITPISSFIVNIPHRNDCQFNKTNNWKDCDCKAVYFSPFGHDEANYTDNPLYADVVLVDTQFPNIFDLNTWRGTDNLPCDQSRDFAWFKTLSGTGWNPGNWTTGDTSTFNLISGVRYKYIRASQKQDEEPPYIVINKQMPTSYVLWIKAIKDSNNKWISLDTPTDMIVDQNDYFKYNHKISRTITSTVSTAYTSSARVIDYMDEPVSIWTSDTVVVTGTPISIQWPAHANYGDASIAAQTPTVFAASLCSVSITYTINGGSPIILTTDGYVNVKTFTPEATGVYNFTMVGKRMNAPTVTVDSIIPAVSVFSPSATTDFTAVSTQTVTTSYKSISYVLNIPLTGWNYSTNSYDITSIGARPIWVEGTENRNEQTRYKGINIWGGSPYTVADYLILSQTPVSKLILSTDLPIEYNRKTLQNMYWYQPIGYVEYVYTGAAWRKLLIDTSNVVSPLFKLNDLDSLSVTGTEVNSEIILDVTPDSEALQINYYANKPFTWNQTLSNLTLGEPPTGGIWVPILSSQLVAADIPYAHLTNRHYPTYASAPYVGNLFEIKDVGGFFIPSMLGASTFLSKNMEAVLDTSQNIAHDENNRIFRDITKYATDRGLTERDQKVPVLIENTNAEWMKNDLTEFAHGGTLKDSLYYQDLAPYQSKYESIRVTNGIFRPVDSNETWQKYTTYVASTALVWPTITLQFLSDIENYNEFVLNYLYTTVSTNPLSCVPFQYLFKYKTDIFGNQYSLYKRLSA